MATHGIAQQVGQKHCISGYEHFKGKEFLHINTDIKEGQAKNVKTYWEESYYNRKQKFYFNIYDESLYKLARNGKDCLIKGLLQDERYLDESSELKFTSSLRNFSDSDMIICNIRGGEYRTHRRFQLNQRYWLNALNILAGDSSFQAVAVTDDPEYALSLYPFQFVVSNSIEACFATLLTANRVICSNSTFAYWPIRIGKNASEVIAPAFFNRPYSNFWASPQNYYEGYRYLTPEGAILTRESCLKYVEASYPSKNCDVEPAKGVKPGLVQIIKKFVPATLKEKAKRLIKRVMGW